MLSYHGKKKKTTCMYETTLYMPHVPGQPPTHHLMQVPMGNQYRVSPDSHHTTRSLCDIYLIVSCHFGQQNFPGVSYTLRHFLGFHRWIRCLTRFSSFSPEGVSIPYFLHLTLFVFHFHLTLCDSIGLCPILEPTQFSTKRSAKSVPCTHTHVMR